VEKHPARSTFTWSVKVGKVKARDDGTEGLLVVHGLQLSEFVPKSFEVFMLPIQSEICLGIHG